MPEELIEQSRVEQVEKRIGCCNEQGLTVFAGGISVQRINCKECRAQCFPLTWKQEHPICCTTKKLCALIATASGRASSPALRGQANSLSVACRDSACDARRGPFDARRLAQRPARSAVVTSP